MPKLRLTGRKAVLVGVSAAAASAAVITLAVPATAAPSQRTSCTDTVRVRAQPNETAPVIGSCQSGEIVIVDGTRNGFAHLVNKRGWASLDFVSLRGSNSEDSDLDDLESGFNDDNDKNKNDKKCTFSDNKYRYDGDERYKCRNGKRDYDESYNKDDNDNDNNDNNNDDNDNKPLGGLLG